MKRLLLTLGLLIAIFCHAVRAYAQSPTSTDTLFPFNFTLVTLDSTEINTQKLFKKPGKGPTVLAFWLTTCPPCHQELAAYSQHFAEWQERADFRLVAVSIDFQPRFQQVVSIAKEKKFPFEIYWDRDRRYRELLPGELNGLPQVFIFDKNGKLVWHHKRYRPGDENEVFAEILKLQ